MAKAIKRVAIMLLAVAIICLMAIGVLLGATSAKSKSDNLLDLNNKIVNAVPPTADKTVRLNGATSAAQATIWTNIITEALTGKHIKVVMDKDWLSPISEDNAFGDSTGFSSGRINVPKDVTITFDLNGHVVDRRKTSYKDGGTVFYVEGTFNLVDSVYEQNKIKLYNSYLDDPNTDLTVLGKSLGFGRISGGWGGSGAFLGDTTSTLNIYGGMICNNNAQNLGLFSVPGIINIYDVLVSNNHCYTNGGVISYSGTKSVNIHGGIFYNNSSTQNGSVIYMSNENAILNITGGIIAHNKSGAYSAIELKKCKQFNLSGGEIAYNHSDLSIGAVGVWSGTMNMTGGKIINNTTAGNGAGIYMAYSNVIISGGVISGNQAGATIATGGGGISCDVDSHLTIKAGAQIYGNTATGTINNGAGFPSPKVSNIWLRKKENKIIIDESLLTANKSTHVGVHLGQEFIDAGDKIFTTGFGEHNSGGLETLKRFFFADDSAGSIGYNGSEGVLQTNGHTSNQIEWEWEGEISGTTQLTHITLPYYSDKAYKISGNFNDNKLTLKNKNGESKKVFEIKEKGSYAFYVDGDYQNPTFMVTIEEKTLITSPDDKIKTFLYNGSSHTYLPEGFDSSIMEIKNNVATNVGVHTAKIILKNKQECVWRETGNYRDLEYKYVVLPPGIKAKDLSGYEYLFKDNTDEGVYRKMYIEKEYWHLLNDSVVNQTAGNARYVLGNIVQNTNIEKLINNLENNKALLKIYNSKGEKVFNGVLNDDNKNILIATGFKVELYENSTATQPYDEVYLSILGDVVADGVINTLDVTYINRISKGEIKLETLSIEEQLAAMVDNKGKVTSTDGKILLNVIGGNTQTNSYFESNANITNDYMLWDLSIDNVTGKTFRVGSEITTASLVNNAIIGNIAPQTKASEFKTKLASQLGVDIRLIAIYQVNGTVASDNDYIGTGCYINYNGNTANKIYLTVLGDLTGDGVVNTADITYLNRIVNGNVVLNTNDIKDELTILSASIQNKGNLTTADSETLLNYIGGNADMTKYF